MKLSGPQFQQTQKVLLDAYTEPTLHQMLRMEMDIDLEHVAGGANLSEIVFNLIRWAERSGEIERLINAAYAGNEQNPYLAELVADSEGWFSAQFDATMPADDVPPVTHQMAIADGDWRELEKRMKGGRFTIFLGDDLLEEVAGLPSRQVLADRLALRENIPPGQRLATVAQQVMRHGSRWDFSNFLIQALEPPTLVPGAFYQEMARLIEVVQPELIVTTAYHRLLEIAMRHHNIATNVVVRDEMLRFVDPARITILKLYGDIQQVDSLSVTEQDHNSLLRGRERPEMLDEVRRAFRRTSVLFLGYDLQDPAVSALFDEVAGTRFQTRSYAVWPEAKEHERDSFEQNRGLKVLASEPLSMVQALMELMSDS